MRYQSSQMFVVTVNALPGQGVSELSDYGGASVNCWVLVASAEEAVVRSKAAVREARWVPESIESVSVVSSGDYSGDHTGRQYFEQALVDGIVVVFHTWPHGSPEHH